MGQPTTDMLGDKGVCTRSIAKARRHTSTLCKSLDFVEIMGEPCGDPLTADCVSDMRRRNDDDPIGLCCCVTAMHRRRRKKQRAKGRNKVTRFPRSDYSIFRRSEIPDGSAAGRWARVRWSLSNVCTYRLGIVGLDVAVNKGIERDELVQPVNVVRGWNTR